jgi:hypothetical protein
MKIIIMEDVLNFDLFLQVENVSFVTTLYCETESLSFFENEMNSDTSRFPVNDSNEICSRREIRIDEKKFTCYFCE